eukprot:COSAG06_NODE_4440_length_4264_cov_932.251621_2_plen_71_part_00
MQHTVVSYMQYTVSYMQHMQHGHWHSNAELARGGEGWGERGVRTSDEEEGLVVGLEVLLGEAHFRDGVVI